MNNITNFLQKFLNLEKDNNTKLALILETIKNETGLVLGREMIEIKGDKIQIKCNSVFRTEIFMHQNQIELGLKQLKIFLKLI